MNRTDEICQKQNEPKMLDCQYASRVLFNRAEKYSYHAFACIICSVFCTFISGEIISLIIPLVFDFLILLFGYLAKQNQSKAAFLRNYYDAVVLKFKESDYTDSDLRKISDITIEIKQKNPNDHNVQITNTGRDCPPGVKNWYEFSKNFPDNEAVFECQKQNCWWNDKLCKQRLTLITVSFTVFIALYCLIVHYLHIDILHCSICFWGLIIGFAEQISENIKYIRISKTMNDLIKVPEIYKNISQLEYLQQLIDSRRNMLVLEMDWIHRKNAKNWSEKYEKISNN